LPNFVCEAVKYQLIIFDFDGTLADSFPWFRRVLNGVADEFGFRRVAPGEAAALRGLDAREILRRLAVPRWKLPMIVRHMRTLKTRDRDAIALFPGVDRLLHELTQRGLVLALVSSDAEANVRHTLGAANSERIAHYACGASLFGKRAKFVSVLRRAQMTPPDAIAIGDEIRDAQAARRAGIAFGAVSWGYTDLAALCSIAPDEVFASMDDILAVLA